MSNKNNIKDIIFKGSSGLSKGIFVMLGIGLLLKNIGDLTSFIPLTNIGLVTVQLVAPAIGAGIAFAMGSDILILFSAMIAATIGAAAIRITDSGFFITTGEPIGAMLSAIIAIIVGKKVLGKTPVDMMLVPLASVLVGGLFGYYISQVTAPVLIKLGYLITDATRSNAILSSIIIAVSWGFLVVSPASSVMLALALNLNSEASAAALIGCTSHFIGFALMSYKQATPGALIATLICTPKVQLPNITKNPYLLIPPTLGAIVSAPLVVNVLGLTSTKEIAGMGLSSFVAPLNIFIEGGIVQLGIFMLGIVISGVISYITFLIMKKKGIIIPSDLKM